jgi:MFS family permease
MVLIVPHAIDLGITAVSAANILAIIMGVSIPGNFVLGSVGDRIGNRQVFVVGFVTMSVTLFYLMWAEEVWMLYIFALIFGFAHGGMVTVEAPLAAGLFGLSSLGLVYGVVVLGFTFGAAAGPLVTGYIFDVSSSYQVAFLVSAVIAMIGLIIVMALRPTKKLGGRI